jgi:hypothetical protein
MRCRGSSVALVVALAGWLLASVAWAEPYAIGDRIAPMTFETQFGETVIVGAAMRLVLITHDMDAGEIAKAVLAAHTTASLDARRAVYVADVSKMPGLVSRWIAIPRMRRRPYRVLLDRDGASASAFPIAPGAVTGVWLDDGRIVRIEQLTSADGVRTALVLPEASPAP